MILECFSSYKFRSAAEFVFGDAYWQIALDFFVWVEHQHKILAIVINHGCRELEMFSQKPPHSINFRYLRRIWLREARWEERKQ